MGVDNRVHGGYVRCIVGDMGATWGGSILVLDP